MISMYKEIEKYKCSICQKEMICFKDSGIKPNICMSCTRIIMDARQQGKGVSIVPIENSERKEIVILSKYKECINCKKNISIDSLFCSYCGFKQSMTGQTVHE